MADALELAVELLRASGQLVQSWITRFITINGALLSAAGVILGWHRNPAQERLLQYALLVICFAGIGTTILLSRVLKRQLQWQRAHTQRVQALQDAQHPLYVPGMLPAGMSLLDMLPRMTAITLLIWFALLAAIPMIV